ncbi:putative metal-dependent hydrolase [Desulfosporosinus sp. Sb-LF]|nr:putative metal-dependent hydrolase [Desulfosporosinus sp. Sb-LF]
MDKIRYPIGQFNMSEDVGVEEIKDLITQIENLPHKLANSVGDLSIEQLDSSYREGGWTIRQVVHHIADTYINLHIRIRLAITEDKPTIKLFNQELWAELPDAQTLPVGISLNLIESLNIRLVTLIKSLSHSELNRQFRHPEAGDLNLKKAIGLYAWHGNHHLAHILNFRKSIGL